MTNAEKERLIRSDILSIESQVRHAFNQGYDLGYKDGLQKNINGLQSVNLQEPKIGHWTIKENGHFKCSKCLVVQPYSSIFCPNCGTRMVEPQERSGEE